MKTIDNKSVSVKAFFFALMAVAGVFGAYGIDYLRLVEWADQAIEAEKWAEAKSYLQEAMQAEPSNPANLLLLSNLGMVEFYSGEDSLALKTLTDARAMGPRSVTVLQNRARVLRHMHRDRDAMADYGLILEIDSVNAHALFNRGYLALIYGDTVTAGKDFAMLEKVKPNSTDTFLGMAVYNSNTGKPAKAIPYYTKLIGRYPIAAYYASRAMCRLDTGDLAGASEDIALGLEDDPDDGELYFCRAILNILRFREEDARADARLALEHGADPARVALLFSK